MKKWVDHKKHNYFIYTAESIIGETFFRSERRTWILRDTWTHSMNGNIGKNVANDYPYENAMAMINDCTPKFSRKSHYFYGYLCVRDPLHVPVGVSEVA